MKKIVFVCLILFFLVSSLAGASGMHGDFEGNPIVAVKSDGQELKAEDVPAINYKDRTMVPIYLLKQLGADVTWNSVTYSVNVSLPKQVASPHPEDQAIKDRSLLKDTYQILSDMDQAMWMFVDKLQYYANVDNPQNYTSLLDIDYTNLTKQYSDSVQIATKVNQNLKSDQIDSIMQSQAKALDQVRQNKDLFIVQINNENNSQILSNFKNSMLNCIQGIQQNIDNTKKIQRALLLQEMNISVE